MTNEILDPQKEILKPIFKEGDGVAICAKFTGYGANQLGDTSIMMKSADDVLLTDLRKAAREVRVTLSMEEFLRKFLGMYYEDAKVLAKILGYEVEDEEYYDNYLSEKADQVDLLKSLKTEEDFFKLTPEEQDSITTLQVKFEKGLHSEPISGGATQDKSLKKVNKNSENGEDTNMDKDDSDLKVQIEALTKSLKESEEARQKEAAEREAEKIELAKEAVLNKAGEVAFIKDEDKEVLNTLLKTADVEVITGVVEALNKANTKIEELEAEITKLKEADPMTQTMAKSGEEEDSDGDDLEARVVANLKKMNSKEEG